MKKMKIGILGIMLSGSLAISACSAYAAGRQGDIPLSAKEAAECTMESLKSLDLDQFNQCTDNYVETYHNWIGIPVESEYRVFNELLQPGVKLGKWKKKYEFNRKLSEKMMENLAWKIEDVQEDGNRAEIIMEISNLNMVDVMGKYEIQLLENMIASDGTGMVQIIKDLSNIADDEEGLLSVIESCDEEDISTMDVAVTVFREDGAWKLHLDDAFINAFMGNINAEEYSEEVQERIEELERQQEEKIDDWADKLADRVESWAERW